MLQAPEQGDRLPPECAYCPPAPRPQTRPLKTLALIHTLKRNPLECWAKDHFEKPVVAGGLPIGHVLIINEPQAIRRGRHPRGGRAGIRSSILNTPANRGCGLPGRSAGQRMIGRPRGIALPPVASEAVLKKR